MRPRKSNKHLPVRVYEVHGSYWLRPKGTKAVNLGRVAAGIPAMHEALARALRSLEGAKDTVAHAVQSWKETYLDTTKDVGAETRKTYARIAADVSQSLGHFRISQVETPEGERFLNHWNDRPRMRNEVRKVARQIFEWAVQDGRIKVNPFNSTKKRKLTKRKVYIPDKALGDVLSAMEREGGHKATHNGVMIRAFVELAYLTAQRAQDIRMLRWSDISDGRIRIQPSKTKRASGLAVELLVTPEIQRVLDSVKTFVAERNAELLRQAAEEDLKRATGRRARRIQPAVHSTYVIHRLDGKPFAQTGVRTAWRRAIALTDHADAGYTIKDIRPKSLTDVQRATKDLTMVQEMAAHTSITTTEGYMRDRVTPTVESPLLVPRVQKSS